MLLNYILFLSCVLFSCVYGTDVEYKEEVRDLTGSIVEISSIEWVMKQYPQSIPFCNQFDEKSQCDPYHSIVPCRICKIPIETPENANNDVNKPLLLDTGVVENPECPGTNVFAPLLTQPSV